MTLMTDNSNRQQEIAHILAGAIGSGFAFAVLFMMHNYSYGDPVFDFSDLQIMGLISSIIAGAGAVYYRKRDQLQLSWTFFKIEIVLFTSSIFITGVKIIESKRAVVKYNHYEGTSAVVVGVVYIVAAIWLTWLLMIKVDQLRKKKGSDCN